MSTAPCAPTDKIENDEPTDATDMNDPSDAADIDDPALAKDAKEPAENADNAENAERQLSALNRERSERKLAIEDATVFSIRHRSARLSSTIRHRCIVTLLTNSPMNPKIQTTPSAHQATLKSAQA